MAGSSEYFCIVDPRVEQVEQGSREKWPLISPDSLSPTTTEGKGVPMEEHPIYSSSVPCTGLHSI
jgi:hypothetical protein